ncbi:hypothetical protein ACIQW5_26965 [Methylorubrum thiocyanatum]|uniref:hypothetical protein n=1 Tax=Methylorubrum thiocyanatum TaxID=47958 RepID=UPI00383BA472
MPTHSTLEPVEATTKAIDALLCAIEGNPTAGAVTAYRAAITRHGRNLIETAGPEALDEVRQRVTALSPHAAEDRRQTIAQAWAVLSPSNGLTA